MVVWGVGVLAAMFDSKRIPVSTSVFLFAFVLLLLGSRASHILLDNHIDNEFMSLLFRMVRDYSLAISFSLLIISLQNREVSLIRYLGFHKQMADFSYTIYLMHVPLLVFITAVLSSKYAVQFFVQPSYQIVVIAASIIIGIYILLYAFSLVTERFTPSVKIYLTKLTAPEHLQNR
jgi:peptidoglycan/LPS O-acetylase OafA/YrhL